MAQLNIVMVEPEIPQNTGNVARTCAATGARLHLVGPMGFTIDDKKLKRAGLDYWHLRHTDLAYPDNCYLLFGKETAGLPEKLLFDNPDTTVRIPMIGEARSLNLSNSVAAGVLNQRLDFLQQSLGLRGSLVHFPVSGDNSFSQLLVHSKQSFLCPPAPRRGGL